MAERMSLEALRYAQSVREAGSFSAAARALGVSQPALSNGIAKLEELLGERLFERTTRGVNPTAFGASVLPMIARAVSAIDTVQAEANRWTAPSREAIRVGVSPLASPDLVGRTYQAVTERSTADGPRQLVLSEANLADLRVGLLDGGLDIILIPSVGPIPGHEHRIVDSEPLVLVDSTGSHDPVPLADLAGTQLIMLPDTCGLTMFTRSLLEEHALKVRTYPGEASSYRVLEEWSKLGLGTALLPQSKLSDEPARQRCVLAEDGSAVEVFFVAVWNPRSSIVATLADLADHLSPDS